MLELLGRVIGSLVAFAMIRVVLQIVYRVLRGMTGSRMGGTPYSPPGRNPAGGSAGPGSSSGSTLLHQDPVCGTYVAAGSSFRKICNGKVVHFCSEDCRDRYSG